MKYWITAACLLIIPMMAPAQATTDVSGIWTINGEVSGVGVDETCTVVQKDSTLTGSCDTSTGKYDLKGKLDGDTVTFSHGGKYEGTDLLMTYTGTLATDGGLIGTLDVEPFNVNGNFRAKKGPAIKPAS